MCPLFGGSTVLRSSTKPVLLLLVLGGESGSADTVRDPRGFAVKFYTEDGNWDLVGNNTPIFFIRDPILVRGAFFSPNHKGSLQGGSRRVLTHLINSRPFGF